MDAKKIVAVVGIVAVVAIAAAVTAKKVHDHSCIEG